MIFLLMSPNPRNSARKPITSGIALARAFSIQLAAVPMAPSAMAIMELITASIRARIWLAFSIRNTTRW